ncbi:FH2 domain-containing protein 1 isoform X1 [Pimephales promelas]|uniref:FH2 domain-containing protein 1 isoform X1 n=1 Tax=Pimephales promelas TaxID=90988 RepID=UPI001955E4B2|nr:FH2 domain-containing protein 1 isoform X1 [Pimephales promelas]
MSGGRGFKKHPDDVIQSAVNHLLTTPTSSIMSSVLLANESQSFDEESGVSVLMTPPPLLHDHAPINAPPPAPPLPPPLPVGIPAERKRRVRNFYWKPIPEDRVKQHDGPNLWTLGGTPFRIDIRAIEELFGQHEDTPSSTGGKSIRRGQASGKDLSQQITILDSKRSLNISIFLKHFKKSSESLLEDLLHGHTGVFSVESLRELLKLLPEEDEVKNLQMFSGNPKDLPLPDAFMYQLIRLPRYEVRLKALLLKEEFFPSYTVMKHDIAIVLTAINELLNCEELHNVLHLVLEAGNIMNAGGSAGNAVGFKLSSLLSLADTKANKPGMNLLHFVALEAEKKDLLAFPEKLLHVQQADRVCVDSIHVEFQSLSRRVDDLEEHIHTDEELLTQLQSLLQSAAEALEDLRISIDELQREGDALIDFFCEDKDIFNLDECLRIFQNFCSKFKKAVQENVERGMWEESRRKRLKESEDKRHSWAGHEGVGGVFGLRSNSEADVEAALKREGLLELLMTSPQSLPLRFGSARRSRRQKNATFDLCGADFLPPIQSLSIAHGSITTEEPEIQNKSRSTEESPNNDQTQLRNTEVTPVVTSDPSQINSEVANDDHKARDNVKRTNVTLKTSGGATQSIQTSSKRPVGSKNRPSSSAKPTSSSSCMRKVVPLRTPAPKQAVRPPPEKMCRATLDRPRTSARDSTSIKPLGFARNTVASATRHAVAPVTQRTADPKPPPPRLSLTPAGRLRKSSSAHSENSLLARGARDKPVRPVWR